MFVLRQMCNELNNIKCDYESECENKKNMFCKNHKLTESINALKKEIEVDRGIVKLKCHQLYWKQYSYLFNLQELKSNNCEDTMCELNKTNEEMEALELIIKERVTEMNNCEENVNKTIDNSVMH